MTEAETDMQIPTWWNDRERSQLTHPLATLSSATRGRRADEPADAVRTCFERDGHRILHAKPFRRMRNKTQVFFSPENDHIATRMDHSLYVATISRTICRNLGLNDDLAFAAALGHDLGHAPFGHSGEHILVHLLREHGTGPIHEDYTHEAQSLRVVDALSTLSGHGRMGLNLTYEVRDAIRCHCGEGTERAIVPRDASDDRDPATFRGRATYPISLEKYVIRMADRIAYLGRDYEDAQAALPDSLPALPTLVSDTLGQNNREIIHAFVIDLLEENRTNPCAIGFSEPVFDAMMAFRAFNYEHIYLHGRLEEYREKIDAIITRIFTVLMDHLAKRPVELWARSEVGWPMHLSSLARFISGIRYDTPPAAVDVVADYICLMTDGFAFRVYKSIAFPEPII